MYIQAETLDDLVREVYEALIKSPNQIRPSKGEAKEEIGVLLELSNPRARLSRTETRGKAWNCLGELLWYLTYSNNRDFIGYYLPHYKELYDEGEDVCGAYGPRFAHMRGHNQIEQVINIITNRTDSRRAVIQLFNAEDILQCEKDVPCTCTLQFMSRERRLHMLTSMRSNDAFLGLPYDFFSFTMLQEIFARMAGLEVGVYKHVVGSLHLYKKNFGKAEQYLEEGWQESNCPMPKMPEEDPWPQIQILLEAEKKIRIGKQISASNLGLLPYWEDMVRLLQIFSRKHDDDKNEISKIKSGMHSDAYKPYIERIEVS